MFSGLIDLAFCATTMLLAAVVAACRSRRVVTRLRTTPTTPTTKSTAALSSQRWRPATMMTMTRTMTTMTRTTMKRCWDVAVAASAASVAATTKPPYADYCHWRPSVETWSAPATTAEVSYRDDDVRDLSGNLGVRAQSVVVLVFLALYVSPPCCRVQIKELGYSTDLVDLPCWDRRRRLGLWSRALLEHKMPLVSRSLAKDCIATLTGRLCSIRGKSESSRREIEIIPVGEVSKVARAI